jgi:hypothetical protein
MSDSPKRWWQWLLMYPTLAIALVGAVPQYRQWISALVLGLPIDANVSDAHEQAKAWERNAGCLHDIDHIRPSARTNYSIELVACPSGDILLTLTPLQNPEQPVFRWIVTRDLFTSIARSSPSQATIGQVPATQLAEATSVRIVDIKVQGRTVTRRIQLSDNTCIDETIDTYTGRRLSQRQAPCEKF